MRVALKTNEVNAGQLQSFVWV